MSEKAYQSFFSGPCALILSIGAAQAATCPDPATEFEPRRILALYDGDAEAQPRDTRIHRYLELPLNHLGYVLSYHDLSRGPPEPPAADIAAVLSWFGAEVEGQGYAEWVVAHGTAEPDACGRARKRIMLGESGLDPKTAPEAARIDLGAVGLQGDAGIVRLGDMAETVHRRDQPGAETDFVIRSGLFARLAAAPDATSLLRVHPFGAPETDIIDLAVTGPRGGYLHDSAAIEIDPLSGAALWITEPFGFLEEILDAPPRPVPDVTTAYGRRIYFSTVRSEGWLTAEPARQFGQEPLHGAQLLRDRFILPYPDLPVTVGVLTGDLDPALGGAAAPVGRDVAAMLLAQPQVQPATTGASLIIDWQFFSDYDPAAEAERLVRGSTNLPQPRRGLVTEAMQTLGDAFGQAGQSAFDKAPGAPRKYTRDAFDLASEITAPLAQVAALSPAAVDPLYLWSGGARPFEAALDAVGPGEAGAARAMGGGGGVFAGRMPALSGLSPIGVAVGNRLQIYDALSGDEAYTNFWTGPMHGFHLLSQTLDRTEAPRRLKPFQLSYAARSAIDFGPRSAIASFLERARSTPVFPTTAVHYAAIAAGFTTTRIERIGPARWQITDRGALSTLRFDHAQELALALDDSSGLLGARRVGSVLYVALDPADPVPAVALTRSDDPRGAVSASGRPILIESRMAISNAKISACEIELTAQGFAEGEVIWAVTPGRSYAVELSDPVGDVTALPPVVADADGRLSVTVPLQPGLPVGLRLSSAC